MYARQTLPGPSTADSKIDRAQYRADCLAGRRFPAVTDAVMLTRCQKVWRLREWMEIFKRYHLSSMKDGANRASRFRQAWGELEDIVPEALTRRMIAPWFQQLGRDRGPLVANDVLKELKFVFNKMIEWGWHEGGNPTVGIRKFPGGKPRKRFIHYNELPAVLDSIAEEPRPFQLIFLLSLVVGCRPGEAREMRWADVKFWQERDAATGELVWRGLWRKFQTKTKVKHEVPLPSELVLRFQELDRNSAWCFPGDMQHCRRLEPGPLSYSVVWKAWVRIRRRIGIEDLWGYDLRRSCATILANRGTNLGVISKGVLAHSNMQHTSRYVQAMPETVQAALEEHSTFVMRGGRPEAKPTPAQSSVAPAVDHGEEIEWPG